MPGAGASGRGLIEKLRDLPTRWIIYGISVGICSGLVAVLFFVALELATDFTFNELARMPQPKPPGDQLFHGEPGSPGDERRWVFFLLPVAGGLLSGLLVYRFAPEAAGQGMDQMIRAFHVSRGVVRPRVPIIKGIATILTLASGGSAGKEGPIAQIGGGIGSYLASKLRLSARDRRIMLLAGTAGGLGAIFRAPLGSAITAIEVLYKEDFESDALIPCVISSVTAYVVFMLLLGGERIFAVPAFHLVTPIELPGYLLLALITVPVGRGYIRLYYWMTDHFARLPGPRALRPMLGGLGVGVIGLFFPEAYGTGWGYLQIAMDGKLLLTTMAWIVAAKVLATCLTIGSGGSGGVFGPTLFIGGMIGATIGFGGNALAPVLFPAPAAYVLVGMASFFSGVASAPIGAMLMVAEMTGGYALLPPLMLVSVMSIIFARGRSIYRNQVKDRFSSPAHVADLTINVLEEMRVADVYRPSDNLPSVGPAAGFEELRGMLLGSRDATVPVVDAEGKLVGLLTAELIRPVMDDHHLDRFVVAGDIAAPPVSLLPDDDLYRAHELFRLSGCPQIPVLEAPSAGEGADGSGRIIGMLDYRDMMNAYGKELSRRRDA